ncbi:hypothetical protein SprV_0802482200 [Sparganum proliferum]
MSTALAQTAYSLDVKENTNFTVVVAPQSPLLVTLNHIADTQYSILDSEKVSGTGAIILTPLNDSKRPSAIIIKDVNGTAPDPSLPSGVVKCEYIELDIKEHTALFLIYEQDVRDTSFSGNIEIFNVNELQYDKRLLTIPYNFFPLPPIQCHATPSEGEVADAIRNLHNNKAPGEDGIPAEIFKSCVDTLAPWLHEVIERA